MSYTDDHCRAGFMPNDADCPCKLCEAFRVMGRKCGEAFRRSIDEMALQVLREYAAKNPPGSDP